MAESQQQKGPQSNQGDGQQQKKLRGSFTVEFGDERNSGTFVISALRGQAPVRGRWSMRNLNAHQPKFHGMPDIPGMHLTVDFRSGTYEVSDPLADDQELCRKIQPTMQACGLLSGDGPVVGVESAGPKKLDDDRMKTLLMELQTRIEANQAAVKDGHFPTEAEIEQAPGRELNDPTGTLHYQPYYRDDYVKWRAGDRVPMALERRG